MKQKPTKPNKTVENDSKEIEENKQAREWLQKDNHWMNNLSEQDQATLDHAYMMIKINHLTLAMLTTILLALIVSFVVNWFIPFLPTSFSFVVGRDIEVGILVIAQFFVVRRYRVYLDEIEEVQQRTGYPEIKLDKLDEGSKLGKK